METRAHALPQWWQSRDREKPRASERAGSCHVSLEKIQSRKNAGYETKQAKENGCQGPLWKERTEKFEHKRKEMRILVPKNWREFTIANGKR